MNLEGKKQLAILLLALGLGIGAVVLMAQHIQTSVQQETAKLSKEFENKKVKPLMREMAIMRKEMQKIAQQRIAMAAAGGAPGALGSAAAAPDIPKSSLALRTPSGKRAYTVRIDSLSAVGGLINPGDYVDIIAHLDMPQLGEKTKETISSMIFQNIQILAVGTNLQSPGGYEQQQRARALNVTLALTPEEASLMAFIERNGKMRFALRAPAETDIELIQAANWSSLADYVFEKQGTELVIPRAKAAIAPVAAPTTEKEEVKPFIQIFKGGQEL